MAKERILPSDPPGTRIVNGTKIVPFIGPKPPKRPAGVSSVKVGNYRADVEDDPYSREVLGDLNDAYKATRKR